MSVPTLGKWLFGIQSVAFVYVCCVLPFRYVLRSGRFWRGVLFVWVTTAAFVFCSVLFGQFLRLNVDKSLDYYCFEGPQFLLFAFAGWWPGIMVSTVAIFIYKIRERLNQKQKSQPHETAA